MNRVAEFYRKAMGDEAVKAQLHKILQGKEISDAGEQELEEIGKVAKSLGYDITLAEAQAYLHPQEQELSDEELDAVAGGKGGFYVDCTGQAGYITT